MKKYLSACLAVLAVFTFAGCSSGVSQEEYDKVVAEKETTVSNYEKLENEYKQLVEKTKGTEALALAQSALKEINEKLICVETVSDSSKILYVPMDQTVIGNNMEIASKVGNRLSELVLENAKFDYDCLIFEFLHPQSDIPVNTVVINCHTKKVETYAWGESVASNTTNAKKQPDKKKTLVENFNEQAVIEQLEVVEYGYSDDFCNYAFLAIKNNSEFNLKISASAKFYNESGALIGAKNSSKSAFESGTETLLIFMPDEEYSKMEYELSVSEEKWYECVVSNLTYQSTPAENKEIVSVTNNGDEVAEFVEGYALFFMGDTLVSHSSRYFVDDDDELKSGKTITKELDCYENYDSVKFYFTGRG